MKLYTFTTPCGCLIGEVRAESHAEAVSKYQSWGGDVDRNTDFYACSLEEQG